MKYVALFSVLLVVGTANFASAFKLTHLMGNIDEDPGCDSGWSVRAVCLTSSESFDTATLKEGDWVSIKGIVKINEKNRKVLENED